MLRTFRRHTLWHFLGSKSRKLWQRTKKMEKIVLHLKSTLARPPIYNWSHPEMLSTASTVNALGITNPSSFLLFVQREKSFLKQSTIIQETYFLATFGNKSIGKTRSRCSFASLLIAAHIAQIVFHFSWYALIGGMLNSLNFSWSKSLTETSFSLHKIFWTNHFGKLEK